MRIVVGIGELVAILGSLAAISRLCLWGIQWTRRRARRRNESREREARERGDPRQWQG